MQTELLLSNLPSICTHRMPFTCFWYAGHPSQWFSIHICYLDRRSISYFNSESIIRSTATIIRIWNLFFFFVCIYIYFLDNIFISFIVVWNMSLMGNQLTNMLLLSIWFRLYIASLWRCDIGGMSEIMSAPIYLCLTVLSINQSCKRTVILHIWMQQAPAYILNC